MMHLILQWKLIHLIVNFGSFTIWTGRDSLNVVYREAVIENLTLNGWCLVALAPPPPAPGKYGGIIDFNRGSGERTYSF